MAPAGRRGRALAAAGAVVALTSAGLTAAAVPAGAANSGPAKITTAPGKDEPTASQDNLRTGWDPNEPVLTPATVAGPTFGKVFSTAVNGQVYGQPLVIGSTVIVTTENDWVYGINANTGAILWSKSLGTPYHITSCGDLTPNIGVTSTPVYDPSTGTVYVMALVKEINFEYHLFGLDVNTGSITLKKRIAGSPTNDSHITFNAIQQNQRTGLLLNNGWVYAGFASHCDHKPYAGFVAGVHVTQRPLTATLWTDEAGVSDDQAGIWQSGGGIMSDGPGRIFVSTGNGISPGKAPGSNPPGQLAESVVRLAPDSSGTLSAHDFFSPANAPALDSVDHDFGSGGPVGLPFGTSAFPNMMTQEGKGGTLYILNRDNLGGREQASGNGDNVLASDGPFPEQFGHPTAFADTTTLTAANASSANDYMVFVGKADYMRELKFGVSSSGKPTLQDLANSSFTLGYSSGSPQITSNGTDPSSALIWATIVSDDTGTNAELGAWDLLPQPKAGGGTKLREIWAAPIGTAVKFTTAATSNGMVYVGTRDGHLIAFGVTSGGPLKHGGTVSYPDTPVGSAASTPVSVTAASTVTVSGVSVTTVSPQDPYTVGSVIKISHGKRTVVSFPVTLHRGDKLRAQVRFAPAAPGGVSGAVQFATTGPAGTISVPLIANGTKTGLYAPQTSLDFLVVTNDGAKITNVPVGVTEPAQTSIVNGGDKPVTVTSVTVPSGPYRITGLPRAGTVIEPGQSIPVQVTYTPSAVVTSNSSFTVHVNHGTGVTVALTGTGLRPVSRFTASPGTVNFGPVAVGHTATVMIHVFNRGNQSSLMQRTPLPGGPFGAPLRVTSGLPVNPTYDLVLPVTFHPTKKGAFSGVYVVRWTDRSGAHALKVPITGTGT